MNKMNMFLLTIGDAIIDAGDVDTLLPKYKEQLKVYQEMGTPSTKPNLWQLVDF